MRLFETNIRLQPDKKHKGMIDSLVNRNPKKPKDILEKPFSRNVDIWFFAFCLALKKGLEPIEVQSSKNYNLTADASVISTEVQAFMAITAIQISDDVDIIKDPNKMLKICNNYAAAGFSLLEREINDSGGKDNLEIVNELSKDIIS